MTRGWWRHPRKHALAARGISSRAYYSKFSPEGNILISELELPTIEENPWLNDEGELVSSMGDDTDKYDEPEKYWYHATRLENLQGIIDRGLDPFAPKKWRESDPGVYFAETQAGAAAWLYMDFLYGGLPWQTPIVLLRLKEPESKGRKWGGDYRGGEASTVPDETWRAQSTIDPRDLEVWTTTYGWVPLSGAEAELPDPRRIRKLSEEQRTLEGPYV